MATRAGDAGLLRREVSLFEAKAEGRRGPGRRDNTAISRRRLRLSPMQLIAGLPALGDLLYLSSHDSEVPLRELPPGVLLQSICLAPLLACCTLFGASTITVDGPREWIECQDEDGQTRARLYLLPDTDYLAWDALHAGACSTSAGIPPAVTIPWRANSARLLRFHTRALAGLQVLGAESSGALSPLSRGLAARIVQDEGGLCWRVMRGWIDLSE